MDSTIITALITAATTLLVSMGTWHFSAKQSRKKETEELKAIIESYRDELREKFESLKDEVTQVNASVQQQISVIDLKIETLSGRVEKHNNVIERTYRLEEQCALHEERIQATREHIDRLERKLGKAD